MSVPGEGLLSDLHTAAFCLTVKMQGLSQVVFLFCFIFLFLELYIFIAKVDI